MITTAVARVGYEAISHHGMASVWRNSSNGQSSLHSEKLFNEGDVITAFKAASVSDHTTYLTIQTAQNEHITLSPSFLQYVNHSCDPTVFFDTATMQLICIKAMKPGDECRFFYPSTEWIMAQPFVCNCGYEKCLQLIDGAAFLTDDILEQYRLTHFIIQQLQQKI